MTNILLKNCRLIDGTGNPWRYNDVLVDGDRIAKIGKLNESDFENYAVIDGNNKILAPGFIDMHSHSDLMLLAEPEAKQKIMQGVTTELLGQDGTSIAPIKPDDRLSLRKMVSGLLGDPDIEWDWVTYDDYLAKLENTKTSVNTCTLVPFGQLRQWAMGMDERAATPEEIEVMKDMCRQAFQHGVVGISLGLIYPPCVYASHDEMIDVFKVAAQNDGFLVVHVRNESDKLLESIDEMIYLASEAGIPLHISHLKTSGKTNWHKIKPLLEKLEDARNNKGIQLTFDQYPYIAASTLFSALIPPWAHSGGVQKLLERLQDDEAKRKIKAEMESQDASSWENWVKNSGWAGIVVTSVKTQKNKKYEGMNLVEIAEDMQTDPAEVVFRLLVEEETTVSMVMFWGEEEGVQEIMKHPFYTAGSDGLLGGKPHPRVYGTFARVLGKYCREEGLFSLEEAVRHMTSLPAQILGLKDRGIIKEGMKADLVIFDPVSIIDKATYVEPHQFPEGIDYVIVNGNITVEKGVYNGGRFGKVLRKSTFVNVD